MADKSGPSLRIRGTRTAVAIAAAAVLSAAMAGCAGSPAASAPPAPSISLEPSLAVTTESPPAPSRAPIDPCALITKAEADLLAGVAVQSPEPAGEPPARCVWPTPVTGAVGQVEIDVGDGARKAYDIDATTLQHHFTPVADLGDEAYAEDGAIFFRKGSTWVAIHLVRLDDPSLSAPLLETLARTVAGRL